MSAAFIALQHVLPQHALSRLAGRIASSETPWLRDALIRRFVAAYGVDLGDGLFGQDNVTTRFTIGDEVIATADERQLASPVHHNAIAGPEHSNRDAVENYVHKSFGCTLGLIEIAPRQSNASD